MVTMRSIWKKTLDQTKVTASHASDRVDDGRVGVLVQRRVQTELHPLVLDHPLQFLPAQRSELVDEADPRVQLCVAGQSFLQTLHADEYHAHVATVVEVAQLLAVLRRSASSTRSRSSGCRTTAAFGSPYHVARAPRPSTVPHRLLTACSTLRGVLVTPGVYSTVRHGLLSRGGTALER